LVREVARPIGVEALKNARGEDAGSGVVGPHR
jgi:hypothetical protein